MEKYEVIRRIQEDKIICVVRADSFEMGKETVKAVIKGGIKIIEVTFTVDGATKLIEELSKEYKDTDVIIGAGTVLDAQTARMAILAGAKFIVSPMQSDETMRMCNRYGIPVIPGVMTVKEAVSGLEMGADILKIFPGNAYDESIIGAFKGPLPNARFMPTGGVDVDNVCTWLRAGAVAVGTGSSLTKGAKTNDYNAVTKKALEFVAEVKKVRETD